VEIIGGLLSIWGIVLFFYGQIVIGIVVALAGFGICMNELDKQKQQKLQNEKIAREKQLKEKQKTTVSKSTSTYRKPNNSKIKDTFDDDYEEYVQIRFDNYLRIYTYIAPRGKKLIPGSRIRIRTHEGIKTVTVVKGNYKQKRMHDLNYKVLNVVERDV